MNPIVIIALIVIASVVFFLVRGGGGAAAPVEPKPEPKPEPKAEPKPEPKPSLPPISLGAEPPKPKPEPVEPASAKERPPATDDELRCPAGMLPVTLKGFPRRSLKRGRIVGAKAVAAAREGKAFCVDRYEYPGRKGARPSASVNFNTAKSMCARVGKRLCRDREWRRACGGSFPYGRRFDARRCNTEDADGEERSLAASGKFKRCKSGWGAYDMSGNLAEWTADQIVRGGDFTSADEDAACGAGGRRSAGSARASIGFRCCADFE